MDKFAAFLAELSKLPKYGIDWDGGLYEEDDDGSVIMAIDIKHLIERYHIT